jgi:hypothetical protein
VTKFSSDPGFLKVFSESEKELLKQLALSLEGELKIVSTKSNDMKQLSEFPSLLDAIRRAKSLDIVRNERVIGIDYFYLHSDMPEHQLLMPSIFEFLSILKGY